KFPKKKVDPERADLPAGSKKVPIAEWDGENWKVIADEKKLKRNFKRTLDKYSDSVKEKLKKKTVSREQLKKWKKEGDPPQKPKELDNHIRKNRSKVVKRFQSGVSLLAKLRRRKKKQKTTANS
ncbi:MAG: hypothetical protein AAF063_32680, partial [Cyanobacteria bacterium J06643_5]